MPDLQAVVQRMIDAGESEANIATVIRASKAMPPIGPHPEARIGADPRPGGADFKILGVPIHIPGPDRPRADENMATVGGVGIPPEAVFMGPVQAGRAMMNPALSLSGKAAAGAGSVVSSVAPVIKYEIAKHTLQALGLPESVATVGAIAVSGYKRGSAPAAAETVAKTAPAAEAAAVETAAPAAEAAASRVSTWKDPRALSLDELRTWNALKDQGKSGAEASKIVLAQRGVAPPADSMFSDAAVAERLKIRAATDAAARVQPALISGEPVAVSASGPKLVPGPFNPNTALRAARETFAAIGETPRPAEVSNAMELIRRGKTPEEAVAIIVKARPMDPAAAFNAKFGTLSDDEVRAALDQRNARGQIKTPSAQTAAQRKGL